MALDNISKPRGAPSHKKYTRAEYDAVEQRWIDAEARLRETLSRYSVDPHFTAEMALAELEEWLTEKTGYPVFDADDPKPTVTA